MATPKVKGVALVPKHTIMTEFKGQLLILEQGKTRIREGHPLIAHCGVNAFEPARETVDYEV